MTNVKLKLMFFLLNSLLTADIVHARPYSNLNTTDIIIKYKNNDTISLPIDPNSDTLVVATDEQTRETDKSSKTDMRAMVNAEQDRDEAFSQKTMKDQNNVREIKGSDNNGVEKVLNISTSLLEDIMNSERDREDTITDILFRPESEFSEDIPRFEFLIAAKINESEFANKNVSESDRDKNSSDLLKKIDYVELVEVDKPSKENMSAYMMNITGHEVDNDLAPDTRFTDMQTLFLACFGTLLPLLAVLFATLFIRCLCRRYCPKFCKKTTGSVESESSSKQDTNHQQLKSPTEESGGTGDGDGEVTPANGSIFTMTLKNNHLIVETEERNDITRNGRETKMKYSPDNDGIFIVEVQQSTAYRSNKAITNSPPQNPQISTNQALIHRDPEEIKKKTGDDSSTKFEHKILALSSTGLSISDLSMSSVGSHNISYSYSSQLGYEHGPFGYPVYAGYDVTYTNGREGITNDNSQEPLISKTPTDPDKPVVTAAIFKQDSIIGNDSLQGPGYCIEGSTDGPLLSDVQAREYSLQHLHDHKKMENGIAVHPIVVEKIENTKPFNRADSLPVRLEDEIERVPMQTITEDEYPSKEFLKIKRGSLPIIKTEVYESVREIIPPTSPKFEKFMYDTSPEDTVYDSPPMITITEESETTQSDSTS